MSQLINHFNAAMIMFEQSTDFNNVAKQNQRVDGFY